MVKISFFTIHSKLNILAVGKALNVEDVTGVVRLSNLFLLNFEPILPENFQM